MAKNVNVFLIIDHSLTRLEVENDQVLRFLEFD